MNMRFWRDWLLLWAAIPLFSTFIGMAFRKEFNNADPLATFMRLATFGVFAVSVALFLFAPYFVLKRYLPRYGLGTHVVAVILALTSGFALITIKMDLSQLDRAFSLEAFHVRVNTPVHWVDLLALPWWKLYAPQLVWAAGVFAGPIFIICAAAGRIRDFLTVLLLVLLATLVTATSDVVFEIMRVRSLEIHELNGKDWSRRMATIATWSASAAMGASVSAIGFNRLVTPENRPMAWRRIPAQISTLAALALVPLTVLTLWNVSYATHYTTGHRGFASGFAELRKALSTAPKKDVSVGQNVLSFSHVLNAQTYRYPNSTYAGFDLAPDEKTAVLPEQYGKNRSQLAALDVASGERVAMLGGPLSRYERTTLLWAHGAKYLVLRSQGPARYLGSYTHHETRLRLFELPNYNQVAEWTSLGIDCQHTGVDAGNMIEDGNGNLTILCYGGTSEKGTNPLAITLSLPTLNVLGLRMPAPTEIRAGLHSLVKLNSSVHVPMELHRGGGFVLANIADPKKNITLDRPLQPERGGKLRFQGFVDDEIAAGIVSLRFCGRVDKVSNPPKDPIRTPWGELSFCRLLRYDLGAGTFAGHSDNAETRGLVEGPHTYTQQFKHWKFTGLMDPASKTGTLTVHDTKRRSLVQTLTGKAQRPIAISPSKSLLFVHRPDQRQIAVYTIKPD